MTAHLARRSLVGVLIVAGLVLPMSPARATERQLEWEDDRTYDAWVVPSPVVPGPPLTGMYQPRLDILRSKMTSDGSALVWTANFMSLSQRGIGMQRATFGTGVWYQFQFEYGDIKHGDRLFAFRLRLDPVAGRDFSLMARVNDKFVRVPCYRCTMTADRVSSIVTLRAPIESLASGVQRHSNARRLAPGGVLERVLVMSGYEASGPPSLPSFGGLWFSATDVAAHRYHGRFLL